MKRQEAVRPVLTMLLPLLVVSMILLTIETYRTYRTLELAIGDTILVESTCAEAHPIVLKVVDYDGRGRIRLELDDRQTTWRPHHRYLVEDRRCVIIEFYGLRNDTTTNPPTMHAEFGLPETTIVTLCTKADLAPGGACRPESLHSGHFPPFTSFHPHASMYYAVRADASTETKTEAETYRRALQPVRDGA